MKDNGDDANYGDEIANDGIFSTKYSFSASVHEDIPLMISAQTIDSEGITHTAFTSVFQLHVNKHYTKQEHQAVFTINQWAGEKLRAGLSPEAVVQKIKVKSEVEDAGTIGNAKGVWIKYKSGLQGGFIYWG